jgi:DNA invertase Pin-like site-specific DNA recombinase
MTTATKTVAAYIRVSTASQNEASQRAEITRWLAGNGIEASTVTWYVDRGKSGTSLDRPAFKAMQQAVFMGEVGAIVCYKLDRLTRSLQDGVNLICDWCKRNLRVVCTSQQIDFNGTLGQMLATVLAGFAQIEQETRRERQAVGIAIAKAEGKYRGRQTGTTKAPPARVLELKARGLSATEIAKSLGIGRNTVFVYLRKLKAVSQ